MLKSLTVDGFKIFRHIHLPHLARLNLFVGSNNAGKSCLLEAVRLYVSEAHQSVLRDLVRARDGDWEVNISRRIDLDEDFPSGIETPLRFLFHNFHCEGNPNAIIKISAEDADRAIRLSLALYKVTRDEEGVLKRSRLEGEERFEDADEMLEISVGNERRRVFRLDQLWSRRAFLGRNYLGDDASPSPLVSVGTKGISNAEIVALWDRVSLTDSQAKVIDCLRLIDNRIEGLALVGETARSNERERVPIIRLAGNEERLPLRSMGDGLTRLFHIALAMVNARGGVVLIDEFENGIYWAVQAELWPVLFKLADEFDVQLFVTTHSTDCVQAFLASWRKRPEMGSMYRLENSDDVANAFEMPLENVSDAISSEVELR